LKNKLNEEKYKMRTKIGNQTKLNQTPKDIIKNNERDKKKIAIKRMRIKLDK